MKRATICANIGPSGVRPGFERGHYCKECGVEVQVSPTGRLQLDQGSETLCNACGLALAELLRRTGTLGGVIINPAAQRQIEEIERKEKEGKP